jgi:hypothetical protein
MGKSRALRSPDAAQRNPGTDRPVSCATLGRTKVARRGDVTVCNAGLFDWNYGTVEVPDWGRAGILISDRMITAGDVQYEPRQRKAAEIAPNVLLAIAGDYSIHSQAIKDTHKQLRGNVKPDPYDVALIYGRAIQAIKRRQAEDLYLSPLGLNTRYFCRPAKRDVRRAKQCAFGPPTIISG